MFLLVDIVLSTLLRSGRELMLVRDTVWFVIIAGGLWYTVDVVSTM